MDIIKSIKSVFQSKEKSIYSSMDIQLAQLFAGRGISLKNNFDAYSKSLYVYACVSKIAEKISGIDVELYQIANQKGDTKEINSHAVLDLIYKPNNSQTKAEFMESLVINMLLGGEAFIFKVRENGKITELRNIRPDRIEILQDTEGVITGYNFLKTPTQKIRIETQDIVHFKFFSPYDTLRGFSPITPAKQRIETEDHAVGMQKDFFERDGQPKAFIKLPGKASKEQKDMLREEFETRFSGKNRDSNVAILESGMQYERASLDQKEMDYIESLKFTRDDILTAFKVPKAIISVTDNVKYAEKEAAISIFLSETINPLFKRIVEKLNEELVYTDFDPRLFITYEDPTPENKESIHKLYEIGIKNGYYLVNEIRQWEGLQPIMGGYTRYLPQNMVAVGGLPQQEKTMGEEFAKLKAAKDAQINVRNLHGKVIAKEIFVALNEINKEIHKNVMQKLKTSEVFEKIAIQKPKIGAYSELSKLTDENERDSYYKAVNDILDKKSNEYGAKVKTYFDDLGTKTVRNIIANGSKAFTKAISADDLFNKNKEIKAFAEISLPFVEKFVKEASEETLQAIAPQESFVVTDDLQKKIDERVAMLSESVISTTIDRIMVVVETGTKAGLGINAIADNIQALFVDMSLTRADLIARTETTFANNLGLLTSYKKSGVVTHKEWIATVDNRTRPAHIAMNGEVKKIDEAFSNGLSAPGEPNCRCVMAPAFKE